MASDTVTDQSEASVTPDNETFSSDSLDECDENGTATCSIDLLNEVLEKVCATSSEHGDSTIFETRSPALDSAPPDTPLQSQKEEDPIRNAAIERVAQTLADDAIERGMSACYMGRFCCYFKDEGRREYDWTSSEPDQVGEMTTTEAEDEDAKPSVEADEDSAVISPIPTFEEIPSARKYTDYFPDSDKEGNLWPCERTVKECHRDEAVRNFTPDDGLDLIETLIRRSALGISWKHDVVYAGETSTVTGNRILVYEAVFGKPTLTKPISEADVKVRFKLALNTDPSLELYELSHCMEGSEADQKGDVKASWLESVISWKLDFVQIVNDIRQVSTKDPIGSSMSISEESLLLI